MDEAKRKDALAKGEIEVRMNRSGVLQRQPFKLVREKTPVGDVPFLVTEKFLPVIELSKIAEEYGLPVKAATGKVFPRGKKESDFAGV
jgi:hypothetical protein